MEPVVEVTIQIGLDDYMAYIRYWRRRERPWIPWLRGLYTALILLVSVWNFASMKILGGIILLVFGTAFAIMFFTEPARAFKKNRAAYDAHAVYAFFEDHLCVLVSDRGADSQITAQYSRYLWAAETNTAFYLKTPDKNYINLPRHCFTDEQAQALRELFTRKFGERFKTKI